jgi:hypothetical protein
VLNNRKDQIMTVYKVALAVSRTDPLGRLLLAFVGARLMAVSQKLTLLANGIGGKESMGLKERRREQGELLSKKR